jgi:hypothetical protein
MKLDFKPLGHAPWIMNATVPVNGHFRLSVSYSLPAEGFGGTWWYAGEPGSYEVAVQALDDRYPGTACLVSMPEFGGSNVLAGCGMSALALVESWARKLEYRGAIEVFDSNSARIEKAWMVRFLCACGIDYQGKMEYAGRMWGEGCFREVPLPVVAEEGTTKEVESA